MSPAISSAPTRRSVPGESGLSVSSHRMLTGHVHGPGHRPATDSRVGNPVRRPDKEGCDHRPAQRRPAVGRPPPGRRGRDRWPVRPVRRPGRGATRRPAARGRRAGRGVPAARPRAGRLRLVVWAGLDDIEDDAGPPVQPGARRPTSSCSGRSSPRRRPPPHAQRCRVRRRRSPSAPPAVSGGRPDVAEWVIGALPPTGSRPGGPDSARRPRRPRTRVVAFAAVVVALTVAGSAVAFVHGPSSRDPSSFAGTAPSRHPALASGWQRVSSLGVEVDAPATWPINSWNGCGDGPPPAWRRSSGHGPSAPCVDEDPGVPSSPRRWTSGVPARSPTTCQRPPSAPTTDPPGGPRPSSRSRGATSKWRPPAPDPLLVRRIIASVRPVPVDSVGCLTDLPRSPVWNRRASGPAVDLGRPTSITVCYYPATRGTGRRSSGPRPC